MANQGRRRSSSGTVTPNVVVSHRRYGSFTEPVIAEVVAGARDGTREVQLRRLLERFVLLRFESPTDFDGAVRIYRRCRNEGVTPRGLLDCMVTAVARRHDADILAHDADLARIATVVSLPLAEGSLYP